MWPQWKYFNKIKWSMWGVPYLPKYWHLKKELNWFNRILKVEIQGMLVRAGIISMEIFVLKYLFGWNCWFQDCGGDGRQDKLRHGSTVTKEAGGLGKSDEWRLKLEGRFKLHYLKLCLKIISDLKMQKEKNKSIYNIFKRKTLRKIGNHKKILNKQKRVNNYAIEKTHRKQIMKVFH